MSISTRRRADSRPFMSLFASAVQSPAWKQLLANRRHRAGLATLALAIACAFLPGAAAAADMNKVIRDVFPAAEEGFDPQAAQDLYSGSVNQVIFETLL